MRSYSTPLGIQVQTYAEWNPHVEIFKYNTVLLWDVVGLVLKASSGENNEETRESKFRFDARRPDQRG
jgi:hypothetical protein